MKTKKSKNKVVSVKITNKSLTAGVISKPCLVTLFEAITVSPNGSTQAPAEGLDLTGYSQYRLTLHLVGGQGSEFSIQEMFGPVGSVDQMAFDIGGGQIGPGGILNYRAGCDIFNPSHLSIRISNNSDQPFQVNGTFYAVR